MRRLLAVSIVALVCAFAGAGLQAVAEFPAWAYGVTTPPPPVAPPAPAPAAGGGRGAAPAPDPTLLSLPGAPQQFTRAQISNQYGPVCQAVLDV